MAGIRPLVVLTLCAAALAACMNVHNPQRLNEEPTDDLCESYYFSRQPSVAHDTSWPNKQADIRKELDHRRTVAPDEWAVIDSGHLQVGMSECAVRAAWGYPLRVDHASTAAGDSNHYVYSLVRYANVVNGKITTFHY